MRKITKKAQQEMVGFVLIVVLVIVALMILMVIQMKKPAVQVNSKVAVNVLNGLMGMSSGCIVTEPYEDNMMDLVGHCFEGLECSNLKRPACDYLNETASKAMSNILEVENGNIKQLELKGEFKNDAGEVQPVFSVKVGECGNAGSNMLRGESKSIPLQDRSGNLRVSLVVCQ